MTEPPREPSEPDGPRSSLAPGGLEDERIALWVIIRRMESAWLPCQLLESSFHTSI